MKKTELISLENFMNVSYKKTKCKPSVYRASSFVPFSPLAMLDPTILTIGGIVLGITLIERFLERLGVLCIAEDISSVLRFIMPVTFFGALIYFFMTFSI
ncbi:hypothetical protein [Priestia megaterium]|uniref:hypothetical protein n=1 Tax=Priestia megaterium TaxID=1404 RepID=UPI000BF71982|nr:hypothetical protein [Priestia megaterium]PFR90691.1 hypothetical protein COK39_24665 [Priestia megaterium]